MAQIEPMDIDSIESEFDDKENSLQNSNALTRTPCTEKGYEELDVSEYNMKLRYSITPASSPMSKSYTANSIDNQTYNIDGDSFNNTLSNDSSILTRSLNSTLTKLDTKSPKLPLQTLPNDHFIEDLAPKHRSLDSNITITVNGTYNIDENLSLPSTSSSAAQTPEATTPTKDIPKDGGSPIMRGLKTVLNMFRSSQSPIPPEDTIPNNERVISHGEDQSSQLALASTPKACKNNESDSPKRTSPLKESVVFNEDLERELQWKDDSTIIFKQEKIPIHKLYLQQSTCLALEKKLQSATNDLNSTVEYMDISNNDSVITDKILNDTEKKICDHIESTSGIESEGEFLDCETTYTKHEEISQEILNEDTVDKRETKENIADITECVKKIPCSVLPQNELCVTLNCTNDYVDNVTHEINQNIDLHTVDQKEIPEIDNKMKDLQNIIAVDNINATIDLKTDETLNESLLLNDSNSTIKIYSSSENKFLENLNDKSNLLNTSDCIVNKEIDIKEISNNVIVNSEANLLENCNDEEKPLKMLACNVSEEIILDKSNNATMPLTIKTSQESNKPNYDIDSNNLNYPLGSEQQELSSQNLNSGILQVCMSNSENYKDSISNNGHEHSNITLQSNETELQFSEINLEKNVDVSLLNNKDSSDKLDSADINMNPIDSTLIVDKVSNVADCDHPPNNISCIEIKNCEKLPNFKSDEVIYFDKQKDNKENVLSNLNMKKDDLNDVDTIFTTDYISKSTDFLINDLPADIPLPSDDDIEKDSLTDLTHTIITSTQIHEQDKTFDSEPKSEILDVEQIATDNNILTKSSGIYNLPQNYIQGIESVILQTDELNNITTISTQESGDICNNDDSILKETSSTVENEPNPKPLPALSENNTVTHDKAVKTTELLCENESENKLHPIIITEMDVDIPILAKFDEEIICQSNENNTHKMDGSVESKDTKPLDDEIVMSPNTSPYVSINEINVPITENKSNDIQNPFETKCNIAKSPPISPKLTRRGYNINFDEIDDPFATKTNIRMSPTPEMSPRALDKTVKANEKKTDIQKKSQQHRRKSQPERIKRDVTKKKFNSSYSFGTKSDSKIEAEMLDANNATDLKQDKDSELTLNRAITLPVIETDCLNKDEIKCEKNKVIAECDNSKLNSAKVRIPSEASNAQHEQKKPSTCDSSKEVIVKSVFNLPEIDDMNFNPFVTKSKMRKTPSPTFEYETINKIDKTSSEPINKISEKDFSENLTITDDIKDNTICQNKVELCNLSNETCSSKNNEKELTVLTINTEDEDTGEAPFIEAEDFGDMGKVEDFGSETDMMNFEDLPTDIDNVNKDDGELFIDAEAFEFLLNQNKSNVVADSGKESLFLKFDPLFAKRVSSDGVLSALNRLQKRQSTPKKPPTPAPRNIFEENKPHASTSNVGTVTEDSIDEASATLTKPMMVVNPAINSLVSPRKSTTPPRINRRSLTFTSPAMAVIDRLLSLSANNSTLDHETTTTISRQNREYNETDIALTQLRELLAEKEIHVHNLRSESKELKDRLATMESQVKSLEKESEERLKKVSELNDRLSEKVKMNKSMAVVVEEYERTIASLIAEMEQEKRRNAEERSKLISERDEQTAHLSSMEVSFNDLHSKYEKSKQIILSMKANEDTYKKSIKEFEENLLKMQNNYELLKQHATSKLNHANQELEKFNRAHESEVLKLNAMIKRKELHITSLEESLAQKTKANEELTAICDELINKVG